MDSTIYLTLWAVLAFVSWLIVAGGAVLFGIGAPLHLYKQLRHAYGLSRFSALWRFAVLFACVQIVLVLFLLILLGHNVQDPALMVAILLPLIALSRGLQANNYGLFVLQTTVCFVLLAESLAQDWDLAEVRLLNALFGVVIALSIALLVHGLRQLLSNRAQRLAANQPQP